MVGVGPATEDGRTPLSNRGGRTDGRTAKASKCEKGDTERERERRRKGEDKKGENPKRFLLTSFPLGGLFVGSVVAGRVGGWAWVRDRNLKELLRCGSTLCQ